MASANQQRGRNRKRRSRKIWFERFFLQYGAGARFFKPLTRWKYWNRFCWIVIALGILGWIAALWFLRSYTE